MVFKIGRCTICSRETENKVNDNIGGQSYLCSVCQSKFEKCEICGEYYLGEELAENGICDNCNGEDD